jgi:lipoprotein NlpD
MSLRTFTRGRLLAIVSLLALIILAGCAGWKPAEEKSGHKNSYQTTTDGHYRVRRGDTLHAIAFSFGMDWRDVASWNDISSPYTIYPDQELRLSAPKGQHSQQQPSTPTAKTSTSSKPSTNKTVVKAAPSKSSTSTTYDNTPKPVTSPPVTTADPGKWLWPVEGRVISNFKPNDPSRKGIDIGGKEGQAVIASAAGEVVYSGSGLIGYGELIIIKHSERLLSAYAHNRKRLVAEGQNVTGGERIAEMGRNDRNQAMLHFEIRLNGNPQNPLKYLPGR